MSILIRLRDGLPALESLLLNQYVTWPDDFLPTIPYTLGFALVHWVIKDKVITVRDYTQRYGYAGS